MVTIIKKTQKYLLFNKGSMVLERVESLSLISLLFEEQHQEQEQVWGSHLDLIIDISIQEQPHKGCMTSSTP
jgi:hypothetical protein